MKILVTGSSGLIGSQAVEHFDARGHHVHGVDNNLRRVFFGPEGDTAWNLKRLRDCTKRFEHHDFDVRDETRIFELFQQHKFGLIIHCAAQPSHDKACEMPLEDFEINAVATVKLLEATRRFCPESVFVHMSTNKVYGDSPNEIPVKELETRWEYARQEDWDGVSEECRIDRSLHSLFGASKLAADVMAQEYGRYFGMNVGIFRGGCLTGPSHSGAQLHGFLNYLVRVAVKGETYSVFGYKGKQVRDQIHSFDVIRAIEAFAANPRQGEVYNIGGGRCNNASILECFDLVREITGKKVRWNYVDRNRMGDHICYISNMAKFKFHYPTWELTRTIPDMVREIASAVD